MFRLLITDFRHHSADTRRASQCVGHNFDSETESASKARADQKLLPKLIQILVGIIYYHYQHKFSLLCRVSYECVGVDIFYSVGSASLFAVLGIRFVLGQVPTAGAAVTVSAVCC